MDFDVRVAQINAPVWNRDEVKNAVAAKLTEYENVVYTPELIASAKADRAELNKIAKAIEDERKRVKAVYNAPYLVFEKEVKEIVGMIDKTVNAIDMQVKAFEAKAREEKLQTVREMFAEREMLGVPFDAVFNDKWVLASTSLAAVGREMDKIAEEINADMSVLDTLTEYKFEAVEMYKKTRSLADAMREVNECKARAERKAQFEGIATVREAERKPQEIIYKEDGLPDFDAIGDGRHTVVIKAYVTDSDEVKIRQALDVMNVKYEIIGG